MAEGFIGVFDSGAGGVSVLRELVRELPGEDFRFLGDSANAPYGERSDEEIYALTDAVARSLVEAGAKALVIACNTATSVAATGLRQTYDLPIIGVEPALKPACEALPGGRILVMATPATLRLEKFHQLEDAVARGCEVVCAPCAGLAGRIEQGRLDAPDLHELLVSLVGAWAGKVDGVVLGCTHYPFVADQIRAVLGDVSFFDGAAGTARQTRRVLAARGLLRDATTPGTVTFSSTLDTPETLALYRQLFEG